jgi:hypothetical protein
MLEGKIRELKEQEWPDRDKDIQVPVIQLASSGIVIQLRSFGFGLNGYMVSSSFYMILNQDS